MRKTINNLTDQRVSSGSTECPHSHIPNKRTAKILRDAKAGKGLVKAKSVDDLLKKLGI